MVVKEVCHESDRAQKQNGQSSGTRTDNQRHPGQELHSSIYCKVTQCRWL